MKKYLIASLLALSCPHLAQAANAAAEADTATQKRVSEQLDILTKTCKLGSARQNYLDFTLVHTITEWTGACANGLREGYGALSTRDDRIDNLAATRGVELGSATSRTDQGTFIRGEPVGLWCATQSRVLKGEDKPVLGCGLRNGVGMGFLYRKEADGRWQAWGYDDKPVEPPVFLAAGSLETESARLIADARAGKVSKPVEIVAQTQMLDDLVRGGRIAMALNNDPLDLKSKRVAMILSSHSLTELERYRQMRQGLIDATLRGARKYPSRDKFITVSNPGRVIPNLASGLTPNVRNVMAADDLSVLTDGKADYALIVDWQFSKNFNLSETEYMALPFYGQGEKPGLTTDDLCNLFRSTVSAWLINRELRAVRRFDLGRECVLNSHFAKREYENLLQSLAHGFGYDWNPGFGHGLSLRSLLEQEAERH